MSNCFGRQFRLMTAGESHGPAMVAIVDGCPAGLALDVSIIQQDLDRRKPACSKWVTQRQESDQVKILSGVFRGQTTGASIALMIENHDAKPHHYDDIEQCFRPGHADYTYHKKYGVRDHRGGGRASARETAMWVAAGAIAKQLLQQQTDIVVQAGLAAVGDIQAEQYAWQQVYNNDCYFLDADKVEQVQHVITELRKQGDSIGGSVCVRAQGVPVGLGEPVFAKLNAQIAAAMMGINAVKAVEIGDGMDVVNQRGSQHRDEILTDGFASNHAGGILGGISTGQDILVRAAVKPPSSIRIPAQTIDVNGKATEVVTEGRHDVCVAIRAVPVAQAMMNLVLADAWLGCHPGLDPGSRENNIKNTLAEGIK
ncbi:MAG: chorismate synthase [Coxiellaceae bacterium]|nr:chorismate synthase [Coxiellaceae bacterium]